MGKSTKPINYKAIYEAFKEVSNNYAVDSFSNVTLNHGVGTSDPTNATQFVSDRFKTWDVYSINSIVRENSIIRKILSFKSTKPLRKGIDLNSKEISSEDISKIKNSLRMLNKELSQLIFQGESYGGSAALICIRGQMDQDELIKPLNINKVQPDSFLGLKVLERWFQVVPDMENLIDRIGKRNGIENPNLIGEPLYFKIRLTPNSEELTVHRSRLLIYNTGFLPNIEKRIEQFWGSSIVERIWEALSDYYTAKKYGLNSMLFNNQLVILIDAFTDIAAGTEKAKEQIKYKLSLIKEGRNYSNILFLSKDDEVQHFSNSLSETDKLITKQAIHLACEAGVPYSWLFDDSTYDYMTNENSFDSIKDIQDLFVRDWYNVLIPIIYKNLFGGKIPQYEFTFKPIKENDDKTIAEIISKVSQQLLDLYKESAIDKETLIKSLGEITNNISDVYNNFQEDFIKTNGKTLKIDDQVELARALNKGKDTNVVAEETINGENNEKKPTPRVKIND